MHGKEGQSASGTMSMRYLPSSEATGFCYRHVSVCQSMTSEFSMNVSLTPRLEAIVRQKVESGLYNNASEVVGEAIRLMDERDQQVERLRAALAEGKESLRQGTPYRWNEESVDEVIAMARHADADGGPISDDVRP
jgi:antitoxin ParD1/3/4